MSEPAAFNFHWGNTELRGWALGSDGDIIDAFTAPTPLEEGRNKGFSDVLAHCLGEFVTGQKSAPLLFAGMVGAVNGWHPAPYSNCPITPEKLLSQAKRFEFLGHPTLILPGATCADSLGNADIMRGEEVQLLAVSQLLGLQNLTVSIPGRHCKHATLSDGALTSFQSFVTGELFDLLLGNSLVGALATGTAFSAAAFSDGVQHGARQPLATAVFASRANTLTGRLAAEDVASFLSGVLIGHEAAQLRGLDHPVALMATGLLAERHGLAYEVLGIPYQTIDAKICMRAGLQRVARCMLDSNA
ncbi:2-dehydro-3-deoxygalactonokinase [Cognatishimia sp. SS12]|uniref:2-dehydro-3-deoxygalactonokinase n=1 Tax=Cognatishimia sp. SS12 TaxID=2979465 RepID=UPI00232D1A84|nr:2-dehydro-3-deoxygalactonokinase [Cognatishimia sp. SS12]MDC0738316.1 2-dehydro-3-deoxygalactonokinase [Cognatishimia sp. SS12]